MEVMNLDNKMILAENHFYDLDCHKTKVNNNVLVVGASGTGKTRNVVTPNLLQATGSYVVSDPKGNLYKHYATYLRRKGYVVKRLDFTNPEKSVGYNPFRFIRCQQDIVKLARMLTDFSASIRNDPFWDDAAELLFTALIAYIMEVCSSEEQNLVSLQKLLAAAYVPNIGSNKSPVDRMMQELEERSYGSFAVRQYAKFRVAAEKTLQSILITANSKLGVFDTDEMRGLLSRDGLRFDELGRRKMAVFVIVSDTDRSMDVLANLFYSQAMNELCLYADEKCDATDNKLPVDVRFILDDFATNAKINEFPRMIASIRSRGISAMLMIQSEAQLRNAYGDDDMTIIGNCDTYLYLGGNDVNTAEQVARRCDRPVKKVLNMPVGTCWIFRRGQEPVYDTIYSYDRVIAQKGEVGR